MLQHKMLVGADVITGSIYRYLEGGPYLLIHCMTILKTSEADQSPRSKLQQFETEIVHSGAESFESP
jgi:hypothetical protein